jgi:Mce-associated membrane protein
VLVSVLVVLAIAASVLLAVVAQRQAHHNAVNAARKDATAAARAETAATLTYDYRHLDADFAAAERGLTAKFRASYAQTTASSVVPLATKTHAVSSATIAASGVISASADSAQILVYADQTVQNNLLKATSRLDRSVVEVSMVKVGGRWLIDNLQPF